jgi:hypothetical protein
LQAPREIFVERLARLASPISDSVNSGVSIRLIYVGWHASLLPLIFTVFHLCDSITSDGHSESVIEMKEFERSTY